MPCHEQLRWTKGLEGERAGIPSKVALIALIQVCDMVNDIYIYTKKLQQWIYSNESFCNQFPYAICIFLLFVFGGRYTRSESPIFNGRPSSTIGYGWELGLITTLEILLVCEITTLVGWNQKTTYRYVEYITSHNSWHHSENWYALVMSSTLNPRVPRRLAFGCYGPYHLRHDTLWNQAK